MNKHIEKALSGIPIPDELHQCVERAVMQTGPERKRISMKKSIIRAAAIAAAAAVLAVGATSVAAFSGSERAGRMLGFAGSQEAYSTAIQYISDNAGTEDEKNEFDAFILAGEGYAVEAKEVDLQINGLTPAYHVRLKVGGKEYKVYVNAINGKVVDFETTVDENWDQHVAEINGPAIDKIVADAIAPRKEGDLRQATPEVLAEAQYMALDVFGAYSPLNPPNYNEETADLKFYPSYDEHLSVVVRVEYGGRVRYCKYDSVTKEAEVLSDDPDGDVYEAYSDGRIGMLAAYEIAAAEKIYPSIACEGSVYVGEGREPLDFAYTALGSYEDTKEMVRLVIDPMTGEIVYRETWERGE